MANIYHKFHTTLPTVVLLILFCFNPVFQVSGQRATRQSAQDAFNKGDYEKAYGEFNELLEVYSKDPLYKYYASVCLIKLEQNPEQAETLIKQAIENNTAARPIPSDVTFYLARALQMNGAFTEAIEAYQRFANQAGRRIARDFKVQEYIQQCSKGEGAIAKTQPEKQIETEPNKLVITNPAAIPLFTAPENIVNSIATPVSEPLPDDYSSMLDKALAFQFLADSVRRVNVAQRSLIDNLPNDKRAEARALQAENEKLAASYQNSADEMFASAQALINRKTEEPETPSVQPENNREAETTNNYQIEKEEVVVVPSIAVTQDVYYYFNVTDAPSFNDIQIDPEMPDGLNYRIQMAVFRNPVAPALFKGITPVYGIRNANNPELKTYYAGIFRKIDDARNALTEVKNRGFRDSFIVSFLGTNVVSNDRAAVLEQEWGMRPLERVVDNKPVSVVSADTLPPTLVFRVEVMIVTRAITPSAVESLQTIAGGRGLDIITTDDKKIAYIIGNFITFDSATDYADLLIRNGYREAKVVAWLGKREIPLEVAKQLFESLE